MTLNKTNEFKNLKTLKIIDGLARLSVQQKGLWSGEEELIKIYAKPEQKEKILSIFSMQNQLLE